MAGTSNRTSNNAKQQTCDLTVRQGFVPIYVHDDLDSRTLVDGAVEAGCDVLEYTCRRHDAREIIPWIKKQYPHVKVFGATLMDGQRTESVLQQKCANFISVDEMADLGVDGFISFLRFRPQTYEKYADRMVFVPGVSTANEAIDQLELGADLVKAVVSTTAGEELVLKSRVATHNALPFLITGGVTAHRAAEMIQAGVVVATSGFDLLLKQDLEAGQTITTKLVAKRVRSMLDAVREARRTHQPELAEAIDADRPNLLSAGPWISD